MHPQQVVKLRKYHHERSTEEVCWGGKHEEESKGGEGEVCVREGESKRMRVELHGDLCLGGIACVYLGLEGRMVVRMSVEAKVSDSEAR